MLGEWGNLRQIVNDASRLDDVASSLAQHLAHVAKPVAGLTEQLGGFRDIHRRIGCHPGVRELGLTGLVGDCGERIELRLAPFDRVVGGGRCHHGCLPSFPKRPRMRRACPRRIWTSA